MNTFYIKIIAIVTMVIDHIGAFLLPEVFLFRIIGRLSFLLFAWLIANGAMYTRNTWGYMKRLFVLALVSQIPYMLVHQQHGDNFLQLNIFFTLLLGLTAISILKQLKNSVAGVLIVIIIVILAEIYSGGFSYGAYGVVSILIFYLCYNKLKFAALFQALAIFVFFTLPIILAGESVQHLYTSGSIGLIQPIAFLSIFILALYNGKEGPKAKYIFYLFYPVHLLIIYLLLLL